MNRLVRYQAVQELPVILGTTNTTMSLMNIASAPATPPNIRLRFTDISLLADVTSKAYIFEASPANAVANLAFIDCQLRGGYLSLAPNPGGSPPATSFAMT